MMGAGHEGGRSGTTSTSATPRGQRSESVHHRVEAMAASDPASLALVSDNAELSYGELNSRANRVAWVLRSLDVGPGTLVGVLAEPSIDRVVAVLGALKAGGAYVPLDPAYPIARLEFMLEHSGAGILLTHGLVAPDVAQRLGGSVQRTIRIDDEAAFDHSARSLDNREAVRHQVNVVCRPRRGAGAPASARHSVQSRLTMGPSEERRRLHSTHHCGRPTGR